MCTQRKASGTVGAYIAIGRVVPSLMTMRIVSGMEKHITEHCQLYFFFFFFYSNFLYRCYKSNNVVWSPLAMPVISSANIAGLYNIM